MIPYLAVQFWSVCCLNQITPHFTGEIYQVLRVRFLTSDYTASNRKLGSAKFFKFCLILSYSFWYETSQTVYCFSAISGENKAVASSLTSSNISPIEADFFWIQNAIFGNFILTSISSEHKFDIVFVFKLCIELDLITYCCFYFNSGPHMYSINSIAYTQYNAGYYGRTDECCWSIAAEVSS